MKPGMVEKAMFEEAVAGLERGDFSNLESLFIDDGGEACRVVRWHGLGWFKGHDKALAEALSCACFNGRLGAAKYLLDQGVDVTAGTGTGMSAFHWAVNRGQMGTTRLLIERGAPLEMLNAYGGTVLGCAVWSAIHENKPGHVEVLEMLIDAGADVKKSGYPTGDARVDGVFKRKGF